MSTIASRRGFIAALGAAGSGMSSAAAAPAGARLVDADLMAMGTRLSDLVGRYEDAVAAKRTAKAAFHAACPIPEELVVEHGDALLFAARDETDWDDARVFIDRNRHLCRRVLRADELRRDISDYGPRTKVGKLLRRKLKIAEAYEQTKLEAEAATGIRVAASTKERTEQELEKHCVAIVKAPVESIAGLAVKSQALLAHGQHIGVNGNSWFTMVHARDLARDAIAIATRTEAAS